MAVARVHVRSWQAAYRGLMPAEYLDALRPEDRAARYDFTHLDPEKPKTLVAELGGEICGFATFAPAQDEMSRGCAELFALYVDPERWGQRVGLALIEDARARLVEAGFRKAVLWVLEGNQRAERFYLLDGWAYDGMRRTVTIWGITVEDLRMVRAL